MSSDSGVRQKENEDNRKMIDSICGGSDFEVEEALQNYRAAGREVLGWDQGQADLMERGLRWAVEARRRGRRQQEKEQRVQGEQEQHPGQEQSKQGKQVGFGDEEQSRTGRGSSGFVRGGDERCRADETRKGKGKGNGGKGEDEGKGGGVGRKGTQQVENLVMDERRCEEVGRDDGEGGSGKGRGGGR